MKQLIINKEDILVFDLDDTIYDEKKFVSEGFLAVSLYLGNKLSVPKIKIYKELKSILKKKGRGRVFDFYCRKKKIYSKKLVLELIDIYRFSRKKISVTSEYLRLLTKLKKKYKLYIVTDGNWKVQSHKINTLRIRKFFKKIFFTDYYGKKACKPSLLCFKKIKKLENCNWENIFYFGDNPEKDFKNLNLVGAKTFFVSKWSKKKMSDHKIYNAKKNIKNLNEIKKYLNKK